MAWMLCLVSRVTGVGSPGSTGPHTCCWVHELKQGCSTCELAWVIYIPPTSGKSRACPNEVAVVGVRNGELDHVLCYAGTVTCTAYHLRNYCWA